MSKTDEVKAAMRQEHIARWKKSSRAGTGPVTVETPEIVSLDSDPVVDETGLVNYSDLVGVFSGKFMVKDYRGVEWHPEVAEFIPKKKDHYVPRKLDCIVASLINAGELTMLWGETGTGKDYMVQQYAALVGMPYYRVMGNRNLTVESLLGKILLIDGETVWQDGPLPILYRNGGILVLSEVFGIPPDVDFALQSMKERGGFLGLPDHPDPTKRIMAPHPDFRLVFTSNTRGYGDNQEVYTGTGVADASSIDRIEATVEVPPLSDRDEIQLVTDQVGILDMTAAKMVQLGRLIRDAHNLGKLDATWSPRSLLAWARTAKMLGSISEGFRYTFLGKLNADEKDAVRKMWNEVVSFSEKL